MLNNRICGTLHFLPPEMKIREMAQMALRAAAEMARQYKVDVNWAVLFTELLPENDCDWSQQVWGSRSLLNKK
jgi:hypothetical protein